MLAERNTNENDDQKSYKKWTDGDVERLKRIYRAAVPERSAQKFFEKITIMYGEGRSLGSIQEECRRLGMPAKRFPKSPICLNEDCGIMLSQSTRVGNLCKHCYGKSWQIRNNKNIKRGN